MKKNICISIWCAKLAVLLFIGISNKFVFVYPSIIIIIFGKSCWEKNIFEFYLFFFVGRMILRLTWFLRMFLLFIFLTDHNTSNLIACLLVEFCTFPFYNVLVIDARFRLWLCQMTDRCSLFNPKFRQWDKWTMKENF